MTGSGNETSAHINEEPRMTLIFTAIEDNPTHIKDKNS